MVGSNPTHTPTPIPRREGGGGSCRGARPRVPDRRPRQRDSSVFKGLRYRRRGLWRPPVASRRSCVGTRNQ